MMTFEENLNNLKKVCDEYMMALSGEAYDYHGDDWTEHAEKIVENALILVYGGTTILLVENALKNYHEFKRLKAEP